MGFGEELFSTRKNVTRLLDAAATWGIMLAMSLASYASAQEIDVFHDFALGVGGAEADTGTGIALGDSGNVYTTGTFQNTVDFDSSTATVNHTAKESPFATIDDFVDIGRTKDMISKNTGTIASQTGAFVLNSASNGDFLWVRTLSVAGDQVYSKIDVANGLLDIFIFDTDFSGDLSFEETQVANKAPTQAQFEALDISSDGLLTDFEISEAVDDVVDSVYSEDVVTDNLGNLLITGGFKGTVDFDPGTGTSEFTSVLGTDVFVGKLDADGDLLWIRTFPGVDDAYIESVEALIDYLASSADNSLDTIHAVIPALPMADLEALDSDSSGTIESEELEGIDTSDDDIGTSITVDDAGNAYVAGFFDGMVDFDPGVGTRILTSDDGLSAFVQKLDPEGNLLWAHAIPGVIRDSDSFPISSPLGVAVAVDASGAVYTTGGFSGTVDFDPNAGTDSLSAGEGEAIFVQKLDTAGNFVWAQILGTGGASFEGAWPSAIGLDASGDIYTQGSFLGTLDFDPTEEEFRLSSNASSIGSVFVQKMDSDGTFLWAKAMGTALFSTGTTLGAIGSDLAVDASGRTYATGFFVGSLDFDPGDGTHVLAPPGVNPFGRFLQSMDAEGRFLNAVAHHTNSFGAEQLIATDDQGSVYTTGAFSDTVDFDPGLGVAELTSAGSSDIFLSHFNFVDVTPPVATGVVPVTRGPTNSPSVAFEVEFSEEVVNFDAGEDVLIEHDGTAHTAVTVAGGPTEYTVTVSGISGDGSFTLAVNPDSNVMDGGGNTVAESAVSAPVLIDNTVPDIIVVNDTAEAYLVDCNSGAFIGPNVIAIDSATGTAVSVTRSENVDTTVPGLYTISYMATDASGNTATTTREVTVRDNCDGETPLDVTPPAITLVLPSTTGPTRATEVDFEVVFSEEVVNFDAEEDVRIEHSGTAHTGVTVAGGPLVYTVTVSGISGDGSLTVSANAESDVMDAAGNSLEESAASAPVVIDNTAPDIVIVNDTAGAYLTNCNSGAFAGPNVIAIDSATGTAVSVTRSGDVDTTVPGSYTVTYTATDASGNSATTNRTVTVRDNCADDSAEECLLPASLGNTVYVSANNGSNATGDGSEDNPWRTIGFAMTQVAPCASEERRITIQLSPGDYEEMVTLREDVVIAGADPEDPSATRINPKTDPARGGLSADDSVVLATDGISGNNGLRNLTIELESGAPQGIALLKVLGVSVRVRNVVFNGMNRPGSIAADISSPGSSTSIFENCVFTRVENGVFAVNTAANVTRSRFEDIQGTAVFVRPPDGVSEEDALNPLLGDQDNVQGTGLNTFVMDTINGGSGLIIDTGVTSADSNANALLAHSNNWEGAPTREAIVARVSANVQIDSRIGGGGVLTTTLVVEVVSDATNEPVENATVSVANVGEETVNVDGVYVFPGLQGGEYQVSATAIGFEEGRDVVSASDTIESLTLALELLMGGPDSSDDIAQFLLERFSVADGNGDGGLTFEEATAVNESITAFQFGRWDADEDGSITSQELIAALTDDGSEGEGEGEAPVEDDSSGGCAMMKDGMVGSVQKHFSDLFLLGLAVLTMLAYRRNT